MDDGEDYQLIYSIYSSKSFFLNIIAFRTINNILIETLKNKFDLGE